MSKFKNNQTKNIIGERIEKYQELYDETEVGVPKRKVQTWDLMKQNAIEGARKGNKDSINELRELREIENKDKMQPFVKKNTSPDQRTLTKEQMYSTTAPLNLDINLFNLPTPDPELERQSKEVEQMIRENDNKRKGGLAALLGVDPKKI